MERAMVRVLWAVALMLAGCNIAWSNNPYMEHDGGGGQFADLVFERADFSTAADAATAADLYESTDLIIVCNGIPCNLPNASSSCVDGKCAVSACSHGFGDCNGESRDGCEENLGIGTADNNCGACGISCNGITEHCTDGKCIECGGDGQPCCGGGACNNGSVCLYSGPCGAQNPEICQFYPSPQCGGTIGYDDLACYDQRIQNVKLSHLGWDCDNAGPCLMCP